MDTCSLAMCTFMFFLLFLHARRIKKFLILKIWSPFRKENRLQVKPWGQIFISVLQHVMPHSQVDPLLGMMVLAQQ